MKYLALFRKELREATPWLVLAALAMLLIGGLLAQNMRGREPRFRRYRHGQPDSTLRLHTLSRKSVLADCGPVVLLAATGLGLLLAARQFILPSLLKTWAFTVHRSVSRTGVLLVKVAATAVSLSLGVGLLWTGLFLHASRPGALQYLPRPQVLAEGWLMVALGMVVYLGAALSAISTARWYTTRIFPLAFAVGIVTLALVQWGLAWSIAVTLLALVVLGPQLLHAFLHREF